MVMNYEYDLAKPLASALKAKAPYVGIPIPGHAPLIFKRDKLKKALNGVKPVSIEVRGFDGGARYLAIAGVAGPRCRTSVLMRSMQRHEFFGYRSPHRRAMEKWQPSIAPAGPKSKTARFEKAIAKLQRELQNLGARPCLQNPCVVESHNSDWHRESFLRWRQQKELRRQIGRLGAMATSGKITDRKFYAELAKITTVKRYSDFTENQREALGVKVPRFHNGFLIYADPKNLWKFLPDLRGGRYDKARPRLYYGTFQAWEEAKSQHRGWGVHRYYPILEWSQQHKTLLSQIENVRVMMEDVTAKQAA